MPAGLGGSFWARLGAPLGKSCEGFIASIQRGSWRYEQTHTNCPKGQELAGPSRPTEVVGFQCWCKKGPEATAGLAGDGTTSGAGGR